jgi:4-diphosphocytidyl-2C-methyl-D-erythritol kinase
MEVATAVGADVPFVASGLAAARGEGYGEKLSPLNPSPTKNLVVARPETGQATANAYARLDKESFEWREFSADNWEAYNDFERVAPCASLELIERMASLGAEVFGLTGSGSAVWGAFDRTESVVAQLQELGYWAASAHTLTQEDPIWTF